jgi:hypothetical protein
MSDARRRRVTDLFVHGREVALPGGGFLWVEVLNSFQRQEALQAAQVAKARLVMALERDGRERIQVQARLAEFGRDAFIGDLVDDELSQRTAQIVTRIHDDPDWKERIDVLTGTDVSDTATPLTDAEQALLAALSVEYLAEVDARKADEHEFLTRMFGAFDDEELIERYAKAWAERKGALLSAAEYRLTELWYATRFCSGVLNLDTAEVDHGACDGHGEAFFAAREDVRSAPDELRDLLSEALGAVGMGPRDPKGSDRPEGS